MGIVVFIIVGKLGIILVTENPNQRDIKSGKTTNACFKHIKKKSGTKIELDKVVLLDYEKNWKRRKIKEAVYINAINPTNEMDRKIILKIEKGYVLDEIWSEFNEVHRQSTKKKVGDAS